MKTISIVNQKGGCGKTITSLNLAACLSKKGHRVILIDLDPQGHATFSMRQQTVPTITDILEKTAEGQPFESEGTYSLISENLYFIPSSLGLASLEHKLSSHIDKLGILSNYLSNINENFDYCLLDCPPNLGLITLNALNSSAYSIIPINLCAYSLRGADLLKNIFLMLKEYKGSSPAPFYLLNNIDLRSRFSRQMFESVRGKLGNLLLNTFVRSNIALREAAAEGKAIFEFNSASRGAEDFTSLGHEVEKITSNSGWASLFLKGQDLSEVYVVGDFNNWQKEDQYKLRKAGDDTWALNIPLEKGQYRYKFVAQDKWFADPLNKMQEDDNFGGKHSILMIN